MKTSPKSSPRPARAHDSPQPRSAWRYVPYLVIATSAIIGQISGGVEDLRPIYWFQYVLIVIVALSIEGVAVWMAFLAKLRGELGENVKPFFIISTVFASLATGLNVVSHWGDWWQLGVFGALSAAGYVIWCFDLNALLDDAWDPDGSIRARVPSVRILSKLTPDPDIVRRARRIALLHAETFRTRQGMGPAEAIDRATVERAEQHRREKLEASIRARFAESGADPTDVEMALLAYGAQAIVDGMIGEADNEELARALLARVGPHRLAGMRPPRAMEHKTEPQIQVIDGPSLRAKKAANAADALKAIDAPPRPVVISSDPYVLYADQLIAVISACPDWASRDRKKISASDVHKALLAAVAVGTLLRAITGKTSLLKFAWMLEALSERAGDIPEQHWLPGGALGDVDRVTLAEHRQTLEQQ